MADREEEVTALLNRVAAGDASASHDLLPLLYDELRGRAGRLMSAERRAHTLQRTALVHEAYMRLVKPGASFQSRLHFLNAAALAMRRILLDHAEAKRAQKRGGGQNAMSLDDVDPAGDDGPEVDLFALDEALKRLEQKSARQAQVVNLRFFAGLTDGEIAELLQVSDKTVRRDWQTARLWLYDELSK
jgi:RNA polymerase sigma factor (TIGR02999 family)